MIILNVTRKQLKIFISPGIVLGVGVSGQEVVSTNLMAYSSILAQGKEKHIGTTDLFVKQTTRVNEPKVNKSI